jgi:dTDP-glucose 4,6-dehydratase
LKIFVTGGAGFIGSEFVRMALNGKLSSVGINPSKLIVYDALTYAGNINNLKSISTDSRYEFIEGDICDLNIAKVIPKECDLLVNFAAESHVDRSISDSSIFIKTNVLGTQNLLENSRNLGVKKFIQISTDEVYGSILSGSWDESFPLKPNSPYAASKASADLIALSYARTYGLPVIITRCSNNYGPFQNPEKLIPSFISKLITKRSVTLYGDGKNIREWIHVSDHVRAIAFVCKNGISGEVYNIAGNEEKTNLEITNILLKEFNEDDSMIQYVNDRLGHDFRYALNGSKLNNLGFKNEIAFNKGLKSTVEWYRNNLNWLNMEN